MTLNLCPPEVCSQIFAIACTDGGYTGCALSAVSRYIHDTSSPYKFQSVALHNTRQAVSFTSVLDRTLPRLRGVAFLFISNDDDVVAIDTPDDRPGSTGISGRFRIPSMFSFTSPAKTRPTNDNDHNIVFVEAMLKILRFIAPTLRTLFISFECRWIKLPSFPSASGTVFPTLSSLTEFSLNYRAPTDALFNHYMHYFPLALPSLRCLDISRLKLLSYRGHLFRSIAKIAPSLTHLHLPAKMATNIINAPFASPPIWPPVPEDGNIPVALHRMLIQLNGPHIYGCQNPDPGCTRCRLLAMTADGRFVALEAHRDDTWKRNRECLEHEWMDRISGGEGGWDETSAVDK